MTLPELIDNESLRQQQFPVTDRRTYLAHAAVSPLPRAAVVAIEEYLAQASRGGQLEVFHRQAENGARALLADLLHADPGEIAFAPSTSAALSLLAQGLSFRSGDNVVAVDSDFPSNIYPWIALRTRGVEVRLLRGGPAGCVGVEEIAAAIDQKTRLVTLSSAHYVTGHSPPVDEIGRLLRARGILFCVDGIQTLGASTLNTSDVDFVVAGAHKWLLGPQGIAVLYVSRRRLDELSPALLGWKSYEAEDYALTDQLRRSASRYEPGTLNALGIVGLHASLRLLKALDFTSVASRVQELRERLRQGLRRLDYVVVGGETNGGIRPWTGIVSFKGRGSRSDMRALFTRLGLANVVVSLRTDPAGDACIRAAPHCYNSEDEIDRLLDVVKS